MRKTLTMKRIDGREILLTPISLVGVLVPRPIASPAGSAFEFKLITLSGVEYLLLTDAEWERVLENYRWEQVRVRGLLNAATMSIVPQWVLPHGPTGETQRVSDRPLREESDLLSKIKNKVEELVLAPTYA